MKKLKITENGLAVLLSFILFVYFSWLSYLSEGAWGGADNYAHYKFSRYSFDHPEFLLDHWGKPLFTLLSAPFSQFGFTGLKIFNVLVGVLSGFFCFKIARKLEYKNPLLVIFFSCFLPMHFIMMMSGMTEILFAFIIVCAIYLVLDKRYYFSAIVISFLPFTRTEGVVIIPCFFLALLYFRQFKVVPFLATGVLLYSFVGGFYYDDFLWVITKSPYGDASAIYGSGGLYDFIKAYPEITGDILGVLFLFGLVSVVVHYFKREKPTSSFIEGILIASPVIIYLVFHSVLWWKGMGGSLGLTRVMAGVMPLVALLCLKGWNIFDRYLSFNKFVKGGAIIALLFFVIRGTADKYRVPIPLSAPEQMVKEASLWLLETGYSKNKIYYHDPFFIQMLDMDPTDASKTQQHLSDVEKPEKGIEAGALILWDAHFSPNEGRLPLERLTKNEHFEIVGYFIPDEEFTVLGGHNYEIYIFQKIK